MSNDKFEVTSEILHFFETDVHSKPWVDEKNIVSKFKFSLLGSHSVGDVSGRKDEDGDYLVARKGKEKLNELTIYLEHSVATEVSLVGLQIWRAALLLSDFIIHFQDLFKNRTILEVGSGVGLTSIVAGMFAKKVICTDLDIGNVLTLIKSNVERNKKLLRAEVCVHELDFFNCEWSSELKQNVQEATIVVAADVIYDNDVTQAFVETITKILSLKPTKELYLALEKRYVFTISDVDSVAPCYEHFMSCLKTAQSSSPFSEWKITQVPLNFPQYFNYERVLQLIMYKISTESEDLSQTGSSIQQNLTNNI